MSEQPVVDMHSEIPSYCPRFPSPTAHAGLNLLLLLLVIALCGYKIHHIIKHASTDGFAYLSLFLGALCHISLVSLIIISSDFVYVGKSCVPWTGTLGFGILTGLFLNLSAAIMMITSLFTFSASTYYYARQTHPESPASTGTPTTTQRPPFSSTFPRPPSTSRTFSLSTIIYFILAFIPSFGIALTSPIAFWSPVTLYFLVSTTPLLALSHAVPQTLFLYRCRPASDPEFRGTSHRSRRPALTATAMILAANSVLLVLIGASYYQAVPELDPRELDLIHGWKIWTVLLASALWMGYVAAGVCQGIGVLVCLGVWVGRYWEQNEMDELDGGREAAFKDERPAAAVHDGERVDNESQPLLGNRG